MKAPRLKTGSGTLMRFKRPRPLVKIELRSNGYGPRSPLSESPASYWSWMTASEARQLGQRLIEAAARAEAEWL